MYDCKHCEFKGTQPGHLKEHELSIHFHVQYILNSCDYQATHQTSLWTHIKSKHRGKMYNCKDVTTRQQHLVV